MKSIISITMLLGHIALAANENKDNSFSKSDTELKTISTEELSWRFHITGEVFIVNKDGDKLINIANERREWQLEGQRDKPLESNWRFQQNGLPLIALKQKWMLEKDGRIQVEVAQYDELERDSESKIKFGKLIKEKKFTLNNFSPIDWVIPAGTQKLIVRLTPGIWQNDPPINISSLPVTGKNIVVYDRSGRLWADQITLDNSSSIYVGITTHAGTVLLSYTPFKGAKVIGEVKGSRIKVKSEKGSVHLQSETPFLPKDVKANIYGILLPEVRSERLNSVRVSASDKEEEFLKSYPAL